MPWVFLLLALGAFAVAFTTTSVALVGLSLVAALVLLVLWVLGLLARRVDDRARDDTLLIDPQELRRMREAALARQAAQTAPPPDA